jgi:hypothetical protein
MRRISAGATAAEIRATLSDAVRKLRLGEMSVAEANALSRDAGKTLGSMRAALRLARVGGRLDDPSGPVKR